MDEAAAFAGHVVPAKSDRFFAAPAGVPFQNQS